MGKKVSTLQNNVKVAQTSITGTLNKVSDYIGFDGSDTGNQSGYFLALTVNTVPIADKITVESIGGKNLSVKTDGKKSYVIKVENKDTQSIKITAMKDSQTCSQNYILSGIILG